MWPYLSNNEAIKSGVYTIENLFSSSIQDLTKFSSKERISELVSGIVVIAKSDEKIRPTSEIKFIEPLNRLDKKQISNSSNKNSKNHINLQHSNSSRKFLSTNPRLQTNQKIDHSINHFSKLNSNKSNLPRNSNKRKLETDYNVLSNVYRNNDNLSNWNKLTNNCRPIKEKSFDFKQDSKYSNIFSVSKESLAQMPSFKRVNRNSTSNQNNSITANNQFSEDRDYRNLSSTNISFKCSDVRAQFQNNSNNFSTKIIIDHSSTHNSSKQDYLKPDYVTNNSPVVYTGQQNQLISNNLDPRLHRKQSQVNDPRLRKISSNQSTIQSSVNKTISSDNNQMKEEVRKEMKRKEEELKKKHEERIMQDEIRRKEEIKKKEKELQLRKEKEDQLRKEQERKEQERKEQERKERERKEQETKEKEETRKEEGSNFYDELISAQLNHGPKVLSISAYLKLEREMNKSNCETNCETSNENSRLNSTKKLRLEPLSVDRDLKNKNSNISLSSSLLDNQPGELNLNLNEIEQDLDGYNLDEEDEGQKIINFLNSIEK